MSSAFRMVSTLWLSGLGLFGVASVVGCVDDDGGPVESGGKSGITGGAGGKSGITAGSGGKGGITAGSGGIGGGSGPAGTACESPIALKSSKGGIANFDDYDGSANLSTWSFALGGDPATGIFSGTFGYGDEPDGFPETFEMVAGKDSTYALSISDTLAEEYGGGMGLWISECLDVSAFSGISFWVRGDSPSQTAKLSLLMQETTSSTADTATDSIGTCAGTDLTCIHPTHTFEVTATWAEIRVPWGMFMPGSAAGPMVVPNGKNIWQIQFDVGVVWAPNAAGVYAPTPAPYEFAVDGLTFY